jgi:K+-sensing histidine kinase KdpD
MKKGEKPIAQPDEKIMVCVTSQKTSGLLIEAGAKLSRELKAELCVVHVARTGTHFLGRENDAAALEYLFARSSEVGAEMVVLRDENVVETLIAYAKQHRAGTIVLGSLAQDTAQTFFRTLQAGLPEVKFHLIITR